MAVVLLYGGIIYLIHLFFPLEALGGKPSPFQKSSSGYNFSNTTYPKQKEASKESFFSASAGNDREAEAKKPQQQQPQQPPREAPSAFASLFAPAPSTEIPTSSGRIGEDLESRDRMQASKEYNEKRDYLQKMRSEQLEEDALRSRAIAMREQVESRLNLTTSKQSSYESSMATMSSLAGPSATPAPAAPSSGGGLFSALFGGSPEDNDPRFAQERMAQRERDDEDRMREQARQMREQLEAQWGIKK
jgi:hypothetical protein